MKKLFENKYVDVIIKSIITMLLGWFVYVMIDVRDFMKYEHKTIDEEQTKTISKSINKRCEQINEVVEYKNNNVNMRIDKQQEKIYTMDRKLDLILFKLDIIKDKDLLTKTE